MGANRDVIATRFEGREPSLKGFIYDYTGERNPDQFIKTTKEVVSYVGRQYKKYTSDFTQAVRDLDLVAPTAPAAPNPGDQIAFEMWKLDIKEHRVKEQEYSDFRAGLYNVVFGQCTEALQDKLKSHTDFPNAYQDGIALLTIIKTITYTFEERRKLADALCDIKEMFYTFKQGKNMSLQRYHELFLHQVEVMDEVGITIPDESLVEAVAAASGRPGLPEDADWAAAREQALAIRFIRGTNFSHKKYLTHLRNSYLDGADYYPSTLHEAYNILQRWENDSASITVEDGGVAFVTSGRESKNLDHIICFECKKTGHYANQCPNNGKGQKQNEKQEHGTNLCMSGNWDSGCQRR
jgi:hypothetical protein